MMRLFYLLIFARLNISGRNHIFVNNATNNVKKGYGQMTMFEPSFGDQGKFIYFLLLPKEINRANVTH